MGVREGVDQGVLRWVKGNLGVLGDLGVSRV